MFSFSDLVDGAVLLCMDIFGRFVLDKTWKIIYFLGTHPGDKKKILADQLSVFMLNRSKFRERYLS